jgi:photosystem II stability/assembly factor-like uncharacterized protein
MGKRVGVGCGVAAIGAAMCVALWPATRASAKVERAAQAESGAPQYDQSLFQEMRWRHIGPLRAGRTVAAAGIPSQPNVFIVAANNGGVWKTTDFGQTWSAIFDGEPTGSIGAVAIAQSDPNVIYVGSGEGIQRPDLSVGNGMYKSTDGGKTWTHEGLEDGFQISEIAVDPHDANRLFVAVLGHPYAANETRGVYRSTDGGASWQKALYKDENTGAVSVELDPTNAQVVYADLWSARRPPWTTGNSINGATSGLFKSTDGGNTWKQLTEGLPTIAQGLGRIGIGIAPSDSNRVYAWVDADNQHGGIYRSDDAGATWSRVNREQRIWGRGSDFACVRVDPRDKNTIYVANTSTYRSTDGGENFWAIKGAPGGDDYHTIWINPENPNIILIASDQGATISVNHGDTWSSWYNQPTAQLYHVSTDTQFPYWVYGGQQESGTAAVASRSDYGEITMRDWHPAVGDEYGYVVADPLNANILYGGKVRKMYQDTGASQDVSPRAPAGVRYRYDRTAPLVWSTVDKHALYFASQFLFKTIDGGRSWQTISPDLTRENPGVPPNMGVFADTPDAKAEHRGVIYTIAPSYRDANLIWIGTDDGQIQVTRDAGKTWSNVTPKELAPWSKVSIMDAGHYDLGTAYAAINRLRLDDMRPYIYRTHDGGKSWTKIVAGLPNEPVDAVREDPEQKGLLYAGTEGGVYVSFNDGESWQPLQLNLPHSSMRDLVIHENDLVVGTHGRGIWILDDVTPLRQLAASGAKIASADAYLYKPADAYRVRRYKNEDTPLPPEEPHGQNPPDGALIDYMVKSAANGPLTIEILDASGKLVRKYSSDDHPAPIDPVTQNVPMYWFRPVDWDVPKATPGMHRLVWDLRWTAPGAGGGFGGGGGGTIVHDTPRGPFGAFVLPGVYTVKLTVNGQTYTQTVRVKIDPRVHVTALELAAANTLETRLADEIHRANDASADAQKLRTELKTAQSTASGNADVAGAIRALEEKIVAIVGEGGGRGGGGGGGRGRGGETAGGAPNLAVVAGELNQVYSSVSASDFAPTITQTNAASEPEHEFAELMTKWGSLKRVDLPALNAKLRAAGMAEVGHSAN